MIVTRYVPRGGVGYIIGSVDINGIPRPSKILRGDLNAVLNALAFADKKKHRNPFLVTTYRDPTSLKELGGMKFLEKLMDDIEEVRFPRLKKNQFAYFFALHENVDGSTELNLFVVNVANKRQFSSYVDRRDFASDLRQAYRPLVMSERRINLWQKTLGLVLKLSLFSKSFWITIKKFRKSPTASQMLANALP